MRLSQHTVLVALTVEGLDLDACGIRAKEECEMEILQNRLLNEHDLAELLNVSVASVRRWRLLNQGPRYLKIHASVRYRQEDVSAWLESRPMRGGNARLPSVEQRKTA